MARSRAAGGQDYSHSGRNRSYVDNRGHGRKTGQSGRSGRATVQKGGRVVGAEQISNATTYRSQRGGNSTAQKGNNKLNQLDSYNRPASMAKTTRSTGQSGRAAGRGAFRSVPSAAAKAAARKRVASKQRAKAVSTRRKKG